MQIVRITVGFKISKNFNTITSEEVIEFSNNETVEEIQKEKDAAYNRCKQDCLNQKDKLC
jgi:hypothetical protein